MQIRVFPNIAIRKLRDISFTDYDNFKIILESSKNSEDNFILLSRAEAIFIQYHLNELLEKNPR